jgi:hypothetical protein
LHDIRILPADIDRDRINPLRDYPKGAPALDVLMHLKERG